jgi:hypothetical protein
MKKELICEYELMGEGGTVEEGEMNDYLVNPLSAKIAPKFAPLILIKHATYGVTPQGGAKRRQILEKELFEISQLVRRKNQRLYVSPEQVRKMWEEPKLKLELAALQPDGNCSLSQII